MRNENLDGIEAGLAQCSHKANQSERVRGRGGESVMELIRKFQYISGELISFGDWEVWQESYFFSLSISVLLCVAILFDLVVHPIQTHAERERGGGESEKDG